MTNSEPSTTSAERPTNVVSLATRRQAVRCSRPAYQTLFLTPELYLLGAMFGAMKPAARNRALAELRALKSRSPDDLMVSEAEDFASQVHTKRLASGE